MSLFAEAIERRTVGQFSSTFSALMIKHKVQGTLLIFTARRNILKLNPLHYHDTAEKVMTKTVD